MSTSGLETNQIQIPCMRTVSGEDFALGIQDYNFNVGGRNAWIPAKSYFRIEMTLKGVGGVVDPEITDDIAFAEDVCSCLYNNIFFKAGGQDVSSVVSYVPQTSMVKHRLSKSGAWLKNVGGAFGLESSFEKRVEKVVDSKTAKVSDTLVPFGATTDPTNLPSITFDAAGAFSASANTELDTPPYKVAQGDYLYINGKTYQCTTPPTADAGTGMVIIDTETNSTPGVQVGPTTECYRLVKQIDVIKSTGKNKVFFNWQPPIGIFNESNPMGSGDYRLQLNPNANYKKACIQALRNLDYVSDYTINIDNVQFFLAVEKNNIPATGTDKLHLQETQTQSKKIAAGNNSEQLEFSVPPSTQAITVFVQSRKAGSDNRFPPTLFKLVNSEDENLNSIQLTYANTTKPSTKWDSSFTENTNRMTQRYLDTQIYSGKIWSEGGCESFDDWLNRGPIYHYSFDRDYQDRSTHLQLQIQMGNLTEDANVFIMAHFNKTIAISTTNGYISNVESLSV